MSKEIVEIFTDGACKGNPGVGGWGALLRINGKEREMCGGEAHTTNNRMELMGAIAALEALKRPCQVRLHTAGLIKALERRNWSKVEHLLADNYSDRWGHDKGFRITLVLVSSSNPAIEH